MPEKYQQVSTQTAANLRSIAESLSAKGLSRLSLPEIDAVIELTSKVIPAGNVPGMILSGLARLPGRKPPLNKMHQDINSIFRGIEQLFDQAVYGALFVGPASIIWGYQNLLKLSGKDPEESFPEGVWQFYADYALREDTARHSNETHGFDTLLQQHHIQLSEIDRLTAWVMASMTCLAQFDALLENEWRERVSLAILRELTSTLSDSEYYLEYLNDWQRQRPYHRDVDAAGLTYTQYRRAKFDRFLEGLLASLPATIYTEYETRLSATIEKDLPAYQRQLSILAYLAPGPYAEVRTPFPLTQAKIGIIYKDQYYLVPVCVPGTNQPLDVLTIRSQISSLFTSPQPGAVQLTPIAQIKRSALPNILDKLSSKLSSELKELKLAPILLHVASRLQGLPLAEIRSAERGIGDHALTIFDTGNTFVFDQSHIFFDGTWGAAFAEIMTNEALSWANYLNLLPPAQPTNEILYANLEFKFSYADLKLIRKAPRISAEAYAESDEVNLKTCQSLRKLFKQRNDLLQLTINDLLVLYRSIHATTYQPSPALKIRLEKLNTENQSLSGSIGQLLNDSRKLNPAILIPIDASQRTPKDRIYPLNVEIPLQELDLISLHAQALKALSEYETGKGDRSKSYAEFQRIQQIYLASLAGFGTILKKAKEIAIQGESSSVGAIKMLALFSPPIQRMLDKLPERFELLNNLLKGTEVFSNIGAVAPSSTLTRFITAKDDNKQKQLAWGVLTDANGVMHISLRDFRPHVVVLLENGYRDLANFIAQDYLNSYTSGLNFFVRDLMRITIASRETRTKPGKNQ